ncbi:MAG: phosphoribosylformylglycinamidine synthase subunit PurQ [Candidatus Omnitrophica bacterium]|nr:phosphoribosylformylglycinamidine synthase subunit PurQ [Candidatus Omnitrophota bacterium]
MKFGIVVFPGSNCDQDCFHAITDVLGEHAEYIWHANRGLDNFDCIVLPGGFSYGDYLRTGAIARFSPIMNPLIRFAEKGGLVIGICNGFQILLEAGLLPGTMLRNKGLHFICRYVHVRTENAKTPFTNVCKNGQVLRIPIAHNDGNYYIDKAGLKKMRDNKQIVFRYCRADGKVKPDCNPNGAVDNIAGIVNKTGNVLGMMPHPERSSEKELGSKDGFYIFESIKRWVEGYRYG